MVSHREGSIVKVNESVTATKLCKKSEEVIYEPIDGDEMEYVNVISATQNTAVSIQENPAYELYKTKTTT